jgi:acetyl esterase/lipase
VDGDLRVRSGPVGPVVRPAAPTGTVLLYLHGNPDATAGPESALELARQFAEASRATVVLCRYRPTFPAALLEDVYTAYRYCRQRGEVAVAGERMGATLAAALLVQLREWGAPVPRCAVLVSALLDLTMQADSLWRSARPGAGLDVTELRRQVPDYAGGAVLRDPLVSPLYANLHGLPPVQLLVAGTDPLLDDSLAFAARAARSGVAVDLRVCRDATELRARTVPTTADFVTAWTRPPADPPH